MSREKSRLDEMEIEDRLQIAKQLRDKDQSILSGKGLAEELEEEDTLSWVNKSRQTQQQKLEQQKKARLNKKKLQAKSNIRNQLDELENHFSETNSLKGLKVAHDITEFNEGETTILTLKDSFILKDNYQYNDEEDELEDVTKTELAKLEERKKPSGIKYNPIRELELSNSNKSQENDTTAILSKYNEKEKKKGIVLEGAVTSGKSKEEKLQEIRAKLSSSFKNKALAKIKPTLNYNLNEDQLGYSNTNSNNQQGDSEKMKISLAQAAPQVSFKKRKPKKKKEVNLITPSNPLISELLLSDINNIEEDEEDYGSRSSVTAQANIKNASLKEKIEKQQKREAYSKALEKAKKVSLSLLSDDSEVLLDDNRLYESIENSRKQFLQQSSKLSTSQLVERSKSKWKEREKNEIDLMNSSDPNIFSTTREFCKNIATSTITSDRKNDIKLDLPEEKEKENEPNDEMEISTDSNKASEPIIEEEPSVSDGLVSAIKLFEKRGVTALKDREMYVGRRSEQRLSAEDDPAPHINLEHRDEFGRILTPHEIYRKLSHKFHNKPPGKNKLEKNMRKYQEELKLRNMSYDDTPLKSVESMKKEQERTGLAFVELSGTAKISSSDIKNTTNQKTSKLSQGQKVEFGFSGKRKAESSDTSNKKIKF